MSESGLAFTVSFDNAPKIGEVIRIEFEVPGENHRVAWFANVVWLQALFEVSSRGTKQIKVGVQFHKLPEKHRKILASGLNARFRELELRNRKVRLQVFLRSIPEALMYVAVAVLIAGLFYFFTQYTPDPQPDRATEWGHRFFKRVIKEKPQ